MLVGVSVFELEAVPVTVAESLTELEDVSETDEDKLLLAVLEPAGVLDMDLLQLEVGAALAWKEAVTDVDMLKLLESVPVSVPVSVPLALAVVVDD